MGVYAVDIIHTSSPEDPQNQSHCNICPWNVWNFLLKHTITEVNYEFLDTSILFFGRFGKDKNNDVRCVLAQDICMYHIFIFMSFSEILFSLPGMSFGSILLWMHCLHWFWWIIAAHSRVSSIDWEILSFEVMKCLKFNIRDL